MLQALVLKGIIGAVMKAIEKAPDKKIAKNHEKRIKALEKESHPRADWICMDCGCKAKKAPVKTKKKRIK